MPKNGLLSISEFSQFTGISRSKLIYYDNIGLFPPAVRGDNGYRYYTLQQIVIANFANDMTSFGVPLKKMIALMNERTPQTILELLLDEDQAIRGKIKKLEDTRTLIRVMSRLVSEGLDVDEDAVNVVELDDFHYTLGPENVFQDAANFYPAWLSFMNTSQLQGHNIKFPVGGLFNDMERFIENPNLPSKYYFVNPKGKDLRPKGRYLVAYARGFYGEPGDIAIRMHDFATEHKLRLMGPVFNTFLHDELSGSDPNSYLMQAAIQVSD
ncbi:MAG: MerR family DNA-binding transcriptional regulator [Coriobacteriales bacterium]|jgi:DNA-binding transcriptional MerR regulator|nr:MerR family DNA-binding transcriptional regulator [Coriobacteriales bacterium]